MTTTLKPSLYLYFMDFLQLNSPKQPMKAVPKNPNLMIGIRGFCLWFQLQVNKEKVILRGSLQVVIRDNRHWTALTGMALGLALTMGTAFAGDLEKVEFISRDGGTEINLYTGSIVPYSTVHTSGNKMVIDFRGIQTEDSVRTSFARAKNVSHVIFQPLNEHDVRMIIRGDRLGRPKINFRETNFRETAVRDMEAIDALAIEEIESVEPLASLPPDLTVQEALRSDDGRLVIEDLPSEADGTEAGAAATLPTDTGSITPAVLDRPVGTGSQAENPKDVTRPLALQAEEPVADENLLDGGLSFLKEMNPWETGKAGLLGLLLIGLGLYLKRKMNALKTDENAGQQPAGNRLSFRDLANSRRNDARAEGGERIFSPNRHPKKANQWATRPALQNPPKQPPVKKQAGGSPIGLNSLMNTMGLGVPPQDIRPSKPGPTAQKQVLNQYRKQAAAAPAPKNTLKNEARRSAEVKSRLQGPAGTEARQKLAKKPLPPQGSKNEPIPDNPQVLEFLRNVADLMEKDGDIAKAQRIQKNLHNKNP